MITEICSGGSLFDCQSAGKWFPFIISKTILFGSAARDETNIHSDLDVLVITSRPVHRGHLTEEIYLNLFGVGQAVDVIVVTGEDVESYKDNPYLVIQPALSEGKVLYEREAPVAG